ncbi:PREDICTED: pentatricopeptide repeat-containing protein MRL1, chloroplastic isoform X2 [Camelina sativa]|uniref:Pentatricopeptide repeat-containing protein MRL1, chloroplastic isoform X1 n=2 Tax=Camelina sativa TaxID=90675 RepID=A0ABM0UVN9_CAMSA|nr:PREDICTED: pentatricopeptide repeat-containing protein MRL1, chloroplastic isoform X1 [Camelina sativa]XP_010447033.1 PREDICTED: pentatricopeptide repeat-containing protein MRL1, chloroplastic isoform X2 [Camelina sativa]
MEVSSTFVSSTTTRSSKYLTLTSYSPVILPASSLRSIRRDFLGCCHSLRPSSPHNNLRTRSGKRNSRRSYYTRSPRLVVRASIDSGLILVVVAVTTFSAIAFAYCHNSFRKRNSSDKVTASPPKIHGGESGHLDGDVHKGSPVGINGGFSKMEEKSVIKLEEEEAHRLQGTTVMELEEEEAHRVQGTTVMELEEEEAHRVQGTTVMELEEEEAHRVQGTTVMELEEEEAHRVQESTVMEYDSFLPKQTDVEAEDSQFVVASVSTVAKEHTLVDDESRSSSIVNGSVALESATLEVKTPEKQVESSEEKKSMEYDFSQAVVGIQSIASPLVVDDTRALEFEYNGLLQKPVEYSVFTESKREEIHTFYGPNHSSAKSSRSTSLKAVSPTVTSATNSLLLDHKNNGIIDTQFPGHSSGQVTGDVQEEKLVAHGNGGLSHTRKDVNGDWKFPNDGKHEGHQTDESMPQFPAQIFKLDNSNGRSPETNDAYNRLLRDGRLKDCINLLEDLDQRDLLDMDKIYHASFFKACKKQRAVKEAFRFTKLILNPTLSTFNMLMSVCASSQDIEGARRVLRLVQENGMTADCKLYTTLISSCAKSGKVDAMFEVFHQMSNSGVEANLHTFGALIDGCGRAGQIAKAFGAYGILRSKNVKPDRVVFNALISACGQSGAVDRAFDVLAEMKAETHPIDPDHITIGALMKACFNAGQVERAKEVYQMIHKYEIRGTPEVYTIAVNSCSKSGDWEFACSIYKDMKEKGVTPDEVFFSALIDVAGHAKMLDEAFGILQDAKSQGIRLGTISYSSLMGACCNAKDWKKALELYEKIKSIKLRPTVSTMNALITALCEGNQLPKAMEYLNEIKTLGLKPNTITYSMLMLASERKDDFEVSFKLLSQAKEDGISPNFIMCRCITSLCKRRFEKDCASGEPVVSFKSGRPQIENKWTSMALMVYRETISGGTVPTTEVVSQVLGCLKLPHDAALRDRLISTLGINISQKQHNIFPLVDGFGEYDPRAFSLLEEATSLGVLPSVSFNKIPILFDTTELPNNVAEVYLLTIFKGLKHRLAAGAKIPHINLIISMEEKDFTTPEGEKTIDLTGRVGREIGALLRRLGIPYHRKDSRLRINGVSLKNWFQPKVDSPFSGGKPGHLRSSQVPLGNQISRQQRSIRLGNLSLE